MGTSTRENLCVKNTTTSRRELEIETNIVDVEVKASRLESASLYRDLPKSLCVNSWRPERTSKNSFSYEKRKFCKQGTWIDIFQPAKPSCFSPLSWRDPKKLVKFTQANNRSRENPSLFVEKHYTTSSLIWQRVWKYSSHTNTIFWSRIITNEQIVIDQKPSKVSLFLNLLSIFLTIESFYQK